jgi:hypothetical protein
MDGSVQQLQEQIVPGRAPLPAARQAALASVLHRRH